MGGDVESYKTPVGRVQGLGSAKSGFRHWWGQRVTAVALVPLVLWLGFGLAVYGSADYEAARAWVAGPVTAVLWIVALAAALYHAALGLQVVIEDYVDGDGMKVVAILAAQAFCILLAVGGIIAVLRIVLGG